MKEKKNEHVRKTQNIIKIADEANKKYKEILKDILNLATLKEVIQSTAVISNNINAKTKKKKNIK